MSHLNAAQAPTGSRQQQASPGTLLPSSTSCARSPTDAVSLPRTRLALYLDIGLLAAVLLLFAPRLTGLPSHEWVGLALIPVVLLHLLLSWGWIAGSTQAIGTRAGRRARINYLLNWLLFSLVVLELASGLMISEIALPPLGFLTVDDRAWRALHNQALNWTHLVIGLHVAMNWQPLVLLVRRHLSPKRGPVSKAMGPFRLGRGWMWRSMVIGLAALAIATPIYLWLGPPTTARLYRRDELARFAPTWGHGLGQLVGEALLTALIVYAARRWLRVRL